MTTWHYAIARSRTPGGEYLFEMREVYVDDLWNITGWSVDPIAAHGETWEEIRADLQLMENAVGKRVLDLTLDPPELVDPERLNDADDPPTEG